MKDSSETHLAWTRDEADVILPGPWHASSCFLMDIRTGETAWSNAYRVDENTDNLSAEDLVTYEEDVKKADREEIRCILEQ